MFIDLVQRASAALGKDVYQQQHDALLRIIRRRDADDSFEIECTAREQSTNVGQHARMIAYNQLQHGARGPMVRWS